MDALSYNPDKQHTITREVVDSMIGDHLLKFEQQKGALIKDKLRRAGFDPDSNDGMQHIKANLKRLVLDGKTDWEHWVMYFGTEQEVRVVSISNSVLDQWSEISAKMVKTFAFY